MKSLSPEAAEIMAVWTGETIDRIQASVDEVINRYHYCSTCDARTVLPEGHPHCLECNSALFLERCKGCGNWFCKTGHLQEHAWSHVWPEA